MIAAVSSDLIQSEIALRTVSTQRHHPSRKMVDKGLEKVQEKNNVGQKLHKTPPLFIDRGIKTRLEARTFKQLQTAESFPLLLKPPYGTIASFHLSFLIDE
ncbi:hypothetical protein [Faecalibacterium prausnitzii]|uniref:hypothetical protein n=1 Tax=Faecalibacterium prausnitzii TaxID=853 RepID=UPI00130E8F79|nr:hypothetical protein [Faecalibacterium prausnitzii]